MANIIGVIYETRRGVLRRVFLKEAMCVNRVQLINLKLI